MPLYRHKNQKKTRRMWSPRKYDDYNMMIANFLEGLAVSIAKYPMISTEQSIVPCSCSFIPCLTSAIDHLVDNGITEKFVCSNYNNEVLYSFLACYLVITKNFKTELELSSFKVEDFANFTTVTIEDHLLYRFADRNEEKQSFPTFYLSSFEFHCMEVYYTKVRSTWTAGNIGEVTLSFLLDSGRNATADINRVFKQLTSCIYPCQESIFEMQKDFNYRLSQVPQFRDPRIVRILLVFNAEKKAVNRISNAPTFCQFDRVQRRHQLESLVDNYLCNRRVGDIPNARQDSIFFWYSLPHAVRLQVFERCHLQSWSHLAVREDCGSDKNGRKIGRGVIAMVPFKQNEILLDYHGRLVSASEHDTIYKIDNDADRRSDYLFVGLQGLIVDGSSDTCECHPHTRLLGRLVNHATRNTPACNVVPRFFRHVAANSKKIHLFIIFVAARDIEPLEELRYDYNDQNCSEMFS